MIREPLTTPSTPLRGIPHFCLRSFLVIHTAPALQDRAFRSRLGPDGGRGGHSVQFQGPCPHPGFVSHDGGCYLYGVLGESGAEGFPKLWTYLSVMVKKEATIGQLV